MTYLEFLLSSARFWTLLAALFLGAGLSRLLVIAVFWKAKSEGHRRRIAAFLVFLSAAIACFTLGIFMPPSFEIFSARVLTFGAVAGGVSLLIVALFRYLGAPIALVLAIGVVLAIYINAPWQPVRSEEALARLRVIGLDQGEFSAEVFTTTREGESGIEDASVSEGLSWIIDGSGAAIAPVVELVEYHPAYFLLGRRTAARLAQIVSFDRERDTQGWTAQQRFDTEGRFTAVSGNVLSLAQRAVEALPGISRTVVSGEPRILRLLDTYVVTVDPEGSVAFERVE